jgi:hypothetical protein
MKFQVPGFRFQVSSSEFRVSRSEFRGSNSQLPPLNFRFQISDFRFQISYSRFQISNPKFQNSDFIFQIPDCRFQIRDSRFPVGYTPACATLRRLSSAIAYCLLAIVALGTTACRRDMFDQPSAKPLERNEFYQDNQMASRPTVAHTVARGHLDEDQVFYTGTLGTNLVNTFPFPITSTVLLRGQERFDIYCAPCHGRTGDGDGMIPQRGYPRPPSYHIDRLRDAPVGHFVDVITHGYGVMFPYGTRVDPEDRWAIAAYIRALQLSHNATVSNVPAQERAQLEKAR